MHQHHPTPAPLFQTPAHVLTCLLQVLQSLQHGRTAEQAQLAEPQWPHLMSPAQWQQYGAATSPKLLQSSTTFCSRQQVPTNFPVSERVHQTCCCSSKLVQEFHLSLPAMSRPSLVKVVPSFPGTLQPTLVPVPSAAIPRLHSPAIKRAPGITAH